MYTLHAVDNNDDVGYYFPPQIKEFVESNTKYDGNRIGEVVTATGFPILFTPANQYYPPPYQTERMIISDSGDEAEYVDKAKNLRLYLEHIFDSNTLSSETKSYISK
ncbi:MAG TPA: hypothetical protein DCM40_07260, partial [Maribacter sp.]|nr:hypothetical protein [Maribacter sp.]